MYELYKNKTAENATKKWDDYAISVTSDIVKDIKQFVPLKNKNKFIIF